MPRYYIGLHLGLRWPFRIGPGACLWQVTEWGRTYSGEFDLLFLTLGATAFENAPKPTASGGAD